MNKKEVSKSFLKKSEENFALLYSYARDARYKCNKIKPYVITKMLEKYKKIKELIPV